MTNTEMKVVLKNSGVAVEDIARIQDNYDVERISMIVEAASNPKSAFNAIHAFYPELEVEKLQEQMDFVQKQLQADARENQIDDDAAENRNELYEIFVCGFFNSIKNFFKSNWKAVAVGTAIVVGAALIGAVVGVFLGL